MGRRNGGRGCSWSWGGSRRNRGLLGLGFRRDVVESRRSGIGRYGFGRDLGRSRRSRPVRFITEAGSGNSGVGCPVIDWFSFGHCWFFRRYLCLGGLLGEIQSSLLLHFRFRLWLCGNWIFRLRRCFFRWRFGSGCGWFRCDGFGLGDRCRWRNRFRFLLRPGVSVYRNNSRPRILLTLQFVPRSSLA